VGTLYTHKDKDKFQCTCFSQQASTHNAID